MKNRLTLAGILTTSLLSGNAYAQEKANPNIIFILADDMGYGDVSALNKESKIRTPCIDSMVQDGVSFGDAHSSSSVSTPTRYGLLTGRYNWRSPLKEMVLWGTETALIPPTRTTMASFLKRQDYHTACIGKWHLGWDWPGIEKGIDSIDYTRPISKGPTTVGFDYFYGICGSLDMAPYVYIENDRVTAIPDHATEGKGLQFWRKGMTAPDFKHEETLPHFKDKAVAYIQEHANDKQPFFLYLPLPSPHTPILPSKSFQGKSGIGDYGDFVMETDWVVGEILKAVEKAGIDENTLIVFTTDNGCSPAADIQSMNKLGHYPSYIYRGAKADLFDGGHRVPCVIQWKKKLSRGTVDQTICLTDFFATFAALTNTELQGYEGEDSYNLLPLLYNPDFKETIREATVHHSIYGEFSIRKGDWKLLISPSSGGWSAPTPDAAIKQNLPALQLYNLQDDPGETKNICMENRSIVHELLILLRKYIQDGRSTPGVPQANDDNGEWKQLEQVFQSYPGLF
ncbi:sulfatase family protein [Phocaeicola sp.]